MLKEDECYSFFDTETRRFLKVLARNYCSKFRVPEMATRNRGTFLDESIFRNWQCVDQRGGMSGGGGKHTGVCFPIFHSESDVHPQRQKKMTSLIVEKPDVVTFKMKVVHR
ncbi:hypothetical protein TorRG33x02_279310 [Trema orientale]|uniref:Uncharacterized protein n=1 Tax=Trema orientale TaxID=63057 RepID=A0A2P5CN13_TREOI|nr:hypothetical protein TorRG33x02_279310 [Trema orientale]